MAINPKYLHSDITDVILKAFFTVRSILIYDLDIEIYKQALSIEMLSLGLKVETDKKLDITYRDTIVGSLTTDFLVNKQVVVKLIKETAISDQDELKVRNYLKSGKYEVALILNFDAEEQHKRLVFTNDLKNKPNQPTD